ncbi:hypothetical protein AKO1_014033 [Acrasis kona]|uniref:RING-type E3 ubiquitin transferase n=1 Tax=Acrasis kona TaxID=1008807 RepID=A0AAW2Z3E4_9EUKA
MSNTTPTVVHVDADDAIIDVNGDDQPFLMNGDEQQENNEVSQPPLFKRVFGCCPNGISDSTKARLILLSVVLLLVLLQITFVLLVFLATLGTIKPTEGTPGQEADDAAKNNRGIFTYVIMIPNIFFISCMMCCAFGLCFRRIVQRFMTSNSTSAQAVREHMQRLGMATLLSHNSSQTTPTAHLLELQEQLRSRGVDLYRLQLAMVDRDFNEADYETLLELDNQQDSAFWRGASENEISRLPVFKIPQSSEVTIDGVTPNIVDNNADSPPGTPYCSEKLAEGMIADQASCPICLEDYARGDCVSSLPCLHRFHRDCINRALRTKSSCPVCQCNVF